MAITLSETGYCEAADVGALVQQLTIDATSDPTTAEVEAFITEDFHIINAMLVAAKYTVPVSQSGGSLAVTSGNITTSQAHFMGGRSIALTGTGLDGSVQFGDMVTIASQAQKYMVNLPAQADDAGGIVVPISPELEEDVSTGTVVTYTASVAAKNILKRLNALGTALVTLQAAYSSAGGTLGEDYEQLEAQREKLFDQIAKGTIQLQGLERDVGRGPSANATELVRY